MRKTGRMRPSSVGSAAMSSTEARNRPWERRYFRSLSASSRAFASRYTSPAPSFIRFSSSAGENGAVSPSKNGSVTRARFPAEMR